MGTSSKLTVKDLHRTLEDPRHGGWGYACTRDLPKGKLLELDLSVVAVANELGLGYEDLFHWSDSKHGRWLDDSVYGNGAPPTKATVRVLLNKESVRASVPEEVVDLRTMEG